MADVNSENIGAINVAAELDYSSLAAQYTNAIADAQKAGGDIADALTSGAASASNVGDEIASQLEQISPAAADASSALQEFSGHAEDAGASAEEGASKLAEMAEQFAALGEALAITEGMREFGSEALSAADSITHASVALTSMTGNADGAKETIEQLEQLGMKDGLAMPSLLTAAQRMTAILPAGTDVAEVLGKVADGAAVMGTDIQSAAQRFDLMVNSGTLSGRALTAVGLSLQTVTDALNQVDPAADATTATVAKLFKAMDPGQRIEVLQDALKGLGGTAEQVANETFGGQWQQLANAWEAIMVQVGQAILPVISDLTSFTKTEILPFVKEMVTDFNALPAPVKDIAVAMGLAVAAVVPLTGALAAVGLAANGLGALMPAVTGLMESFGLASAEVAAEEAAETVAIGANAAAHAAAIPEIVASTVATEAAGTAAEESALQYDLFAHSAVAANWSAGAEQLGLFAAAEGGVAAEAGEAAAAVGEAGLGGSLLALGPVAGLAILSAASLKDGYNQLKATLDNVVGTVQGIPGAMKTASEAGTFLGTVGDALHKAWSGVLDVFETYNTYSLAAKALNAVADEAQILLGILPGAATMTAGMNTELDKLQKSGEAAAKSVATLKDNLTPLQSAIHDMVTAENAANDAYAKSLQMYNALSASLANGTAIYNGQVATTQEVAKAYTALQQAATAAGITLAPLPGSMAAIDATATKLAESTGFVVNAQQEEATALGVAKSSMDLALTAYTTSVAKLDILKAQLDDTNAAYAAGKAPRADVINAEENLQKAYAASVKAQTDLNTTADSYANTLEKAVVESQKQALAGMQDMAAAIGPALAKFTGLDDAISALQEKMPGFGVIVTNINTGALAGLQSALDEASGKVAALAAKMAAGEPVGQQYEKALQSQLNAQIALDQEAAVLGTGLQGATDAYSLARDAVAAAQAKVDDLSAAFAQGLTTYDKVQSAQKALTTAQNELNKIVGDSNPLLQAQTAAQQSLAPAVTSTTAAISSQVTALQQQVTALNDVAAAVKGVEADMQAAFGTASSGSVKAGGPQGTYFAGGLVTGAGEFGTQSTAGAFYDTTATAYKNALAAAQQVTPVAGTSPSAIAQDILAQAQAVLQVYEQYYGAGVGVTAQNIQSAQQAVATAQAALQKAGGSTTSSTTSSGASGSPFQNPIVGGPLSVSLPGLTTAASAPSVTSSSSSSSLSPAVDGGSYPAVTAHQASGEVWSVSLVNSNGSPVSSTTAAASISQTISTTVQQASAPTAALTQATQAIGGAVQMFAGSTAQFGAIAQATTLQASATQALATAIAGLVQRVDVGAASTGTYNVTGGGGTASPSGPVVSTVGGGNPLGSYVPPSSTPVSNVPGYNPFEIGRAHV